MSGGPNIPPTDLPVEGLLQEEAASEVKQIRGNPDHDWHHQARPGHKAATERMQDLMRKAYGTERAAVLQPKPGEDPDAPETPRPPLPGEPRELRTAQELADQVALPGLPAPKTPDEVPLAWDPPALSQLYATAEREDVAPLIPEGLNLVARLLHAVHAGQPMPGQLETEEALRARWGRAYDAKNARATEAWQLLPPRIKADITRAGILYHPDFVEYLLRVGEKRWDPSTKAGWRRTKAKALAELGDKHLRELGELPPRPGR